MESEIKEILDKAKEISDYGADGKQHTRMFNQFEAKALLDYITNLQEELEEEKRIEQASLDTITNLQEENQKLNNKTKRLNSKIKVLEHNCKQAEDSCRQHRLANKNKKRRLQRREEQINLYKSRNEKAIEYIENNEDFETEIFDCNTGGCLGTDLSIQAKTLLNILQNDEELKGE